MFKSLKSRGLAGGLLISGSILLLANYSQNLLEDNLKHSHDNGIRTNELSQHVVNLFEPINSTEVSLYYFLLNPDEQQKMGVNENLQHLNTQIGSIQQHTILPDNAQLLIKVKNVIRLQQQLNLQIKDILQLTDELRLIEIAQNVSNDIQFNDSVAQLTRVLNKQIKPVFEALIKETTQLGIINTNLANQSLGRIQYASEQLSSFLWLLAFIFLAITLATFLVFEYWIRIPIETVAKAMHSEASELTPHPMKPTGAIEIDYLIDAFEMMRSQIRLRQQRISSILQNAGEGIILINDKHQIDSVNPAAERIFRVQQEQVINQYFLTLFERSNEQLMDTLVGNLTDMDNQNNKYLCTGLRADGSQFPVDLTISHMKIDEQVFNILMMRDATERISNEFDLNQARLDAEAMQELLVEQVQQLDSSLNELRQTQKQLVESEKMASLAGLVAGVAHEINTPIGIGVTASSHLHSELKEIDKKHTENTLSAEDFEEFLEDARSATHIIQNNLQRAATLVRGFKQVAVDQSSEERRQFDLSEYLQEIILNLHPRLKKTHHQIEMAIPDDITLNSIPGALSQIFTNLILNSLAHAFDRDESGHILISAKQENTITELIYEDDGKGMPHEIREKVFDPFFTTKRGTGGSGLGMHITYNLVTTTLQGSIQCISELQQGTRFIIRIPSSCQPQIDPATALPG